jgi:hypothetical protein
MNQLLDAIRAATAPEATPEARAAGVAACRTILAALEATTGEPMAVAAPAVVSPIAGIVGMLRGVPPDQLLDLAISKLRAALPAGIEVPPVQPLKFNIVPLPRRGGS